MSIYKIKEIEFLTQLPENEFKGDPAVNSCLKDEWLEEEFDCSEQDPDYHLEFILDYVEEKCGMLVGHVALECIGILDPETPESWSEDFPSLSGRYPEGWVWERRAKLIQ
jgi:hypothetical protein